MLYEEMTQQVLDDNGYHEWEADDETLTCPDDGNLIEYDGTCYCGNVSPLIKLGLI